jgi:predicted transcriptional regulator
LESIFWKILCSLLYIIHYVPKQYQGKRMSSIETTSVTSIMTRGVKTEREDQNVLTACRIMHENNIGSVIIVKKDDKNNIKPVGIITERDVVRLLGSLNPSLLQIPLRDIMKKSQDLIPSLLGDKLLIEPKTLHDQFGQFWFSDILRRS